LDYGEKPAGEQRDEVIWRDLSEVGGGWGGRVIFVDVQFLVQVADVVGWCRTYHASLHPAGIVSCTSLSFLMRGFRRKVDESILMERSSRIHLEVVL